MKRELAKKTITLLFAILLVMATAVPASAVIWKFGTTGPGNNPYTPRGYLVDTGSGQAWLNSRYDNSGPVVQYVASYTGIDYIAASNPDGSGYTFYAMTDRNPTPGKTFLIAWKDGAYINIGGYTGTPIRGDQIDPSGERTCWIIPIEGFTLEPGCFYEFGFLRGMTARNGITMVLAEDNTGYLQHELTPEEQARYDAFKYEEYKFVAGRNETAEGTTLELVPMRFTVQTYADLSIWNEAVAEANAFLNSVTEADLEKGRYDRANVEALRDLIPSMQAEIDAAPSGAKYQLQSPSNAIQEEKAAALREALRKAMIEKPVEADMSKLKAKIREAKEFYESVKDNVGTEHGQYGKDEVEALKAEIDEAEAMGKFTPQQEVDAEVIELDNAIIRAKSSKVSDPYVTFRDKATGVTVIAPYDAFPANAQMFVRRMDKKTQIYKNSVKKLSDKEKERTVYVIEFYSGTKVIQPTKEVNVQIPVEEKMKGLDTLVYATNEEGKLTMIPTSDANGMKIFSTDRIESYLVTGQEKREKKVQNLKTVKMTIIKENPLPKEPEEVEKELERDKEQKEELKMPEDELAKLEANTAVYDSRGVVQQSDPRYLFFAAALLVISGIIIGIRTLRRGGPGGE
ncbi:MAG: hypothetical protein ACOYJU_07650 [Anaerovoracaceae bacterium]